MTQRKSKMKIKDHERLDDANISIVIEALEDPKPITKKLACERLNIAYNTTRLGKIIEAYKDRVATETRIRKKLRGTLLSPQEKSAILESYVMGESVTAIAKATYRPRQLIDNFLLEENIPRIAGKSTYHKNVPMIPEGAIKEHYRPEDLVFSARYNCLATIVKLYKEDKTHGPVYSIFLLGHNQERAYQPFYELGDLTRLQTRYNIHIVGEPGQRPRELRIT